ncbi:MAG TPA: hypothetical protein VK277_13895 [Acidimicrobiales bacterium]|nr:hypothetical protein [Acidimicrobiales bacterium]
MYSDLMQSIATQRHDEIHGAVATARLARRARARAVAALPLPSSASATVAPERHTRRPRLLGRWSPA